MHYKFPKFPKMKKVVVLSVAILLSCLSFINMDSQKSLAAASSEEVNHSLQTRVHEYAVRFNQPPVDARIDSVWKAIPSLNGIEVDENATIKYLQQITDKTKPLYLVCKQIPAKIALDDLQPPQPIYRGNPGKKQMALMINVAWGDEYIPSILATLRKEQVKATFFFDGSWLAKHHELAKIIDKEGHDIGNHGYHHLNMDRIPIAKVNKEIEDTNAQIKLALGKTTRLFAPPSGACNQILVAQAKKHNMHTILWTLDTIDWKKPPSQVIIQRIVPKAQNGALVLMHPTAPTAKALVSMIPALKAKGYELVTVSELLSPKRPEPKVLFHTSS